MSNVNAVIVQNFLKFILLFWTVNGLVIKKMDSPFPQERRLTSRDYYDSQTDYQSESSNLYNLRKTSNRLGSETLNPGRMKLQTGSGRRGISRVRKLDPNRNGNLNKTPARTFNRKTRGRGAIVVVGNGDSDDSSSGRIILKTGRRQPSNIILRTRSGSNIHVTSGGSGRSRIVIKGQNKQQKKTNARQQISSARSEFIRKKDPQFSQWDRPSQKSPRLPLTQRVSSRVTSHVNNRGMQSNEFNTADHGTLSSHVTTDRRQPSHHVTSHTTGHRQPSHHVTSHTTQDLNISPYHVTNHKIDHGIHHSSALNADITQNSKLESATGNRNSVHSEAQQLAIIEDLLHNRINIRSEAERQMLITLIKEIIMHLKLGSNHNSVSANNNGVGSRNTNAHRHDLHSGNVIGTSGSVSTNNVMTGHTNAQVNNLSGFGKSSQNINGNGIHESGFIKTPPKSAQTFDGGFVMPYNMGKTNGLASQGTAHGSGSSVAARTTPSALLYMKEVFDVSTLGPSSSASKSTGEWVIIDHKKYMLVSDNTTNSAVMTSSTVTDTSAQSSAQTSGGVNNTTTIHSTEAVNNISTVNASHVLLPTTSAATTTSQAHVTSTIGQRSNVTSITAVVKTDANITVNVFDTNLNNTTTATVTPSLEMNSTVIPKIEGQSKGQGHKNVTEVLTTTQQTTTTFTPETTTIPTTTILVEVETEEPEYP